MRLDQVLDNVLDQSPEQASELAAMMAASVADVAVRHARADLSASRLEGAADDPEFRAAAVEWATAYVGCLLRHRQRQREA